MRLKLYRGRWYAVWREGGTTRRAALRTKDRAEAERALADFKKVPAGDTVAATIASYLADKKHAARGYQGMESASRRIVKEWGHLRPDQIDKPLCRAYTAKRRKEGVGDGTIIKELGVARAATKGAGAVFSLPSAPPPKDRWLTKAEVDKLIDACDLPHIRLFVLLAWSTAARAGAILGLTWDRVDFERGQIKLADGRGGGKGRSTVAMSKRLRAALTEAHKARTTEWVVEWAGDRVRSVKRAFATASTKAKIEEVTPHVIRHSAAVAMAEDGVSMAEIAQVLGHRNPQTTFAVYARYSPDHLKRAMRALD